MGIYVKDSKMPKDCDDCDFLEHVGEYAIPLCLTTYRNPSDTKERPPWCPLIEIPKHGRLVDADKPIELIDTRGRKITVTIAYIIENNGGTVETIIPEEEGDNS